MPHLLRSLLVALALIPLAGCGKAAPLDFKEFTPTEGGCSLLLPGTPTRTTAPAANLQMIMYEARVRNGSYMLALADIPPGQPTSLDGGVQGAANAVSGTVLSQTDFTLGTVTGREVEIASTKPRGHISLRIIVVGNRLYQAAAGGSSIRLSDPDVRKFLDSLKIPAAGPPPAPVPQPAPGVKTPNLQQPGVGTPNPQQPLIFQAFTPSEGGLTILIPGTPQRKEAGPDSLTHAPRTIYSVTTPSGIFMFGVARLRPRQSVNLDAGVQQIVAAVPGATVQSQTNLTVPQGAGKEFELSFVSNQVRKSMSVRLLQLNAFYYQCFVTGETCQLNNPDVRKFLDSFTPAAMPPQTPVQLPPARQPLEGDALVAHWAFEQAEADGTIQDSSSRKNHGRAYLPLGAPGVKGGAILFDGNKARYFDCGASEDFNYLKGWDFTYSGWFASGAQEGTILCQGNQGPDRPHTRIMVGLNGGMLLAEVGDDSCTNASQRVSLRAARVNDNRPHHFALVRLRNVLFLYLDGKRVRSAFSPFAAGPITTSHRTIGLDWALPSSASAPRPPSSVRSMRSGSTSVP